MKRIPNPRDLQPGDEIVWTLTGDKCKVRQVLGGAITVVWPSGVVLTYNEKDTYWDYFRQEKKRKVYRMRREAPKRAKDNRAYRAAVKRFLISHPICAVFNEELGDLKPRKATQVHHCAGREGKLLLDQRHWLAVSEAGHEWIHRHPGKARALGWLYEIDITGRKTRR